MGIGLVVVTSAESAALVQEHAAGEAVVIGKVVEGEQRVVYV